MHLMLGKLGTKNTFVLIFTVLLLIFAAGITYYLYNNVIAPEDSSAAQLKTCSLKGIQKDNITISKSVLGHNLTIKTQKAYGSTITSLTWNGKEYINNFDNGRQIQYDWWEGSLSECYNPVEGGLLGVTPSNTKLLSSCTGADYFSTKTQLGFALPANSKTKYSCGYVKNKKNLSDSTLQKNVQIGYEGIENVIYMQSSVYLPENLASFGIEAPTGYMNKEFDVFYRYNPQKDTVYKVVKDNLSPTAVTTYSRGNALPVILSTNDGKYAIGVYAPTSTPSYYLSNVEKTSTLKANNYPTRVWNIAYYESNVKKGTKTYKSFLVIGSLNQVKSGLSKLYKINSVKYQSQFGYVDGASCTSVGGWAWNPFNANTIIDVNIIVKDSKGQIVINQNIKANKKRDDLKQLTGSSNHGFSYTYPSKLSKGQYTLSVNAKNIPVFLSDQSTSNEPLNNSSKTIDCK